jgi:hypothetical protein
VRVCARIVSLCSDFNVCVCVCACVLELRGCLCVNMCVGGSFSHVITFLCCCMSVRTRFVLTA